jgi:ribosomal protein S18 acetylase RimI-like enzyme
VSLAHQDVTSLSAGGGELRCARVPWDTETFGFQVAALLELSGEPDEQAGLLAQYDVWCAARQVRFSSARLPLERRQALSALQTAGFQWQELVVHPTLCTAGLGELDQDEIGEATDDERAAVEAIAAASFVHQRFHVDPRFPRELADARYAQWIQRSWDDPQDRFLVLRQGGQVAGFWLWEMQDRSAYLHLTAVAPGFQGQGLGRRLWTAGASYLAGQGAEGIRTTVSAANLPVVSLYGRLGWRLQDPEVTLHRWHD